VPVLLPEERANSTVTDRETGESVPAQRTAEGGLFFTANNVPALGWRVFDKIVADTAPEALLLSAGSDAYTWATPRFEIHVNEHTGGLDRVTDLQTAKAWVDTASGYHLNQFLHVSGGNGTAMIHAPHARATDLAVGTHESASVTLVENGPARAVLRIERKGGVSPVDTDLVVHSDGTFDFINVIHKEETLEKEGGYFAFPFGLNTPDQTSAYVEGPYGIFAVDQEQPPGACREWYCVNTFAASGNHSHSACVAAPDTPLFTVGDVNRGLWPNRLDGNRHILFAYVYNNYWHTNYKASQGGDIRCAFSVKLYNAPFDPVAATHFGWARAFDLTPGARNAVPGGQTGDATTQSLLTLEQGTVLRGELLVLDDNSRVLARLYNQSFGPG